MIERSIIRTVWLLGAGLAAVCLLSIYHQPVGWGPPLIVAALAVVAVFRPFYALLVTAGVGPLSAALFGATRAQPIALNFSEALMLAFLLGFAVRRVAHPRPLAVASSITWTAAILVAIPLAAAAVSAAAFRVERLDRTTLDLVRTFIAGTYLIDANPFTATMLFVEGVVLALVVADLCAHDGQRHEQVLRLMVAGGSVTAMFNILKIATAAFQHEQPWHTFLVYFATVRVNVHFADLNAAGSYFALMLFTALGFVPRARAPALAASIVLAAALWIAGSRAALAATLLVSAVSGLFALRSQRQHKAAMVAVGAVAIAVALAAWKWYPQGRNLGSVDAVAYRILLGKIAVGMMAAAPIFGIGAGQFFSQSGQFENAHNNFLQIGAEFGLPALVLLLGLVGFAMRALWRSPDLSTPMRGLAAGLLA